MARSSSGASSSGAASTRVTLAGGEVQGVVDHGLRKWLGVPYADPPVGDLRFRAPTPVSPWTGVRRCESFGDAAPQARRYTATGPGRTQSTSEDCLTLNIVAPRRRSGPLPVVVFIHGGAYVLGSARQFPGDSLVRASGAIFVSINYRLGVLGYLDLTQFSDGEHTFDSNMGLRDQIAALRWVRANIAAFGGDPDNVTVLGESAGGNAVTTLLATPSADGLFAQAVAESAAPALTIRSDWARAFGRIFVEILDRDHGDPMSALRTVSPAELSRAGHEMSRAARKLVPGASSFGPTVDGDLVPIDPVDAAVAGRTHRVPLMIGSNLVEGNLFAKVFPILPTSAGAVEKALSITDSATRSSILDAYKGFPDEQACRQIMADLIFWSPAVRIAEGHSAHSPTYMYRFDYATRVLDRIGFGATHGVELLAVLGTFTSGWGQALTLAGDRRSARRVTTEVQADWASFASCGSPRPGWPRYESRQRAVKIIDDPSRIERDPTAQRRRAWAGFRGYSAVPLGEGIPAQEGARQASEERDSAQQDSAHNGRAHPDAGRRDGGRVDVG